MKLIKDVLHKVKPSIYLNRVSKLLNKKRYAESRNNEQKVKSYDIKLENTIKKMDAYDKIVLEDKLNRLTQLEEQLTTNPEKHEEITNEITEINDLQKFFDNKEAHLQVSNLSMHFGGLKAVNQLNFTVKKNEIFGLIGPNGAGKTTVFNCITQFYKPTFGSVYYKDRDDNIHTLTNYKAHDIIKLGMARTFQNIELIWELSILDNMLVGGNSLYSSGFFTQLLHLPRLKHEEALLKEKAIGILTNLGIDAYKDAYPLGLPYGILKKIELARTLMTNPKFIILDEPAAGLNEIETKELASFIKEIRTKYDLTIFLVEHDMGLVMDVCDRICAVSFGKKIALGSPKEIQQDQAVREAYLGGDD